MSGYRAKKRLGQHFLKSQSVIDNLVELINPQAEDKIVEIGPGRGALTLAMAGSGAKITGVEFDKDLTGYLGKVLSKCDNVEIVNEDFLSYEPSSDRFKLVGNIPYNITSPVVEWVVAHRGRLVSVHLMVQKEMADRLASSPGSKDWSPIAIFTQLHFDISLCFDIAPRHFNPPPKVTSSVIEFVPKDSVEIAHYEQFEALVRASFKQRRKTLVNNLCPTVTEDKDVLVGMLTELSLSERVRAEQVTTAQFLELTKLLVSRNIF